MLKSLSKEPWEKDRVITESKKFLLAQATDIMRVNSMILSTLFFIILCGDIACTSIAQQCRSARLTGDVNDFMVITKAVESCS